MNRKLSLIESICIITGYGIGSGVLILPYYIAKFGFWPSILVLILCYFVSIMLHLMIAELAVKTGHDGQMLSIFNRYLFKGKFKNFFTWSFFILTLATLIANLAIYISGSGLLIQNLLPVSDLLSKFIFYVFAAGFVFFGLKIIGVCEKWAISIIAAVLLVLIGMSFVVPLHPLPIGEPTFVKGLSLYGKIMFVFVAFFSVPQVATGLHGDISKIKTAVILGIGLNAVISLIIVVFSLSIMPIPDTMKSSDYLAIVAWTNQLGNFAKILGTGITILAFLTTFWSISLALSDIVKEQLNSPNWICWVIATLPSFLLTLLLSTTFVTYINLAGGIISILIVIMMLPTYANMVKTDGRTKMLGKIKTVPLEIIVGVGYILMCIGSML